MNVQTKIADFVAYCITNKEVGVFGEQQVRKWMADQLTLHHEIDYDYKLLTEKFDTRSVQFFSQRYFPISFFYLGMLTKKNTFYLKLPNLNMREIFVQYFNEIHQIDVSTGYAPLMQHFINQPSLSELFAGYWEEYISQLPEAITCFPNLQLILITKRRQRKYTNQP